MTKLVAALLRVGRVTTGLAESNSSLPPGLWLTSPAKNRDQHRNPTLGNRVRATLSFFYKLMTFAANKTLTHKSQVAPSSWCQASRRFSPMPETALHVTMQFIPFSDCFWKKILLTLCTNSFFPSNNVGITHRPNVFMCRKWHSHTCTMYRCNVGLLKVRLSCAPAT